MKKIIFTLLALVGTMSMNAQVVKIMKNGQDAPVETYSGSDYYVVFEKMSFGQGYAEATGIGSVKWIQLWENGPKFAEYNVGATSATEYGGYYTWGGTYKNGAGITWNDDHNKTNTGSGDLTSTDDTATNLWGNKWRMPKSSELEALINSTNCTVEWIDGSTKKYNNTSVTGLLCTGKGDYKDNSVFLPAAGYCYKSVSNQGANGYYWSSTPYGSLGAYYLDFRSGSQHVHGLDRSNGYSVRAVLAE
ncbi:MAG: DUF1566 domain-containing protein [Bacteroidaceae bacterium]|nr:DUF1566 domain-containing protein [Bacteroidaceae bacterium]